ncbi:hypothetical protein M0813_09722 [Anaeramoeba flamelloides]|uniref:VWFA domain-containing protein n=1 Tax=Anaeramoeba flamelloides TaxID=1746091 RepID=A0ABQ8X4C2_9EUKA|nr:hypothetical protein M0813_09722 [Anaeramoeba flamelloides]
MHLASKRVFFKPKTTKSTNEDLTKITDQINVMTVCVGDIEKKCNDIRDFSTVTKCSKCENYLNKFSKILTKDEFLLVKEKEEKKKKEEKTNEKEKEEEKKEEKEEKEEEEEEEEEEKPLNLHLFSSNTESETESESESDLESKLEKGTHFWWCEFCKKFNAFSNFNVEKMQPHRSVVDYLMEESNREKEKEKEDEKEKKEEEEEEEEDTVRRVVFCIDISGSMSISTKVKKDDIDISELKKFKKEKEQEKGYRFDNFGGSSSEEEIDYVTRLDCVKVAVGNQLEVLQRKHPHYEVSVVAFNANVLIESNGVDDAKKVEKINNKTFEELEEYGEKIEITQPIGKTSKKLIENLYSLDETGSTALGPAMVVALGIAKERTGSKIVLCTDGKSNIGIGRVDSSDENKINEFYDKLAQRLLNSGVTVDVISFKETSCNVKQIGKLSEKTMGNVERVDPLGLVDLFQNIMSKSVVATNASVELLLHHTLFCYDDDDRKIGSRLEKEIGNVTTNLQMSFTYGVKRSADKLDELPLKIPFQVRINYQKLDGSKWIRAITKQLDSTKNAKTALSDINFKLINQNFMQRTGKLAMRGNKTDVKQLIEKRNDFYQQITSLKEENQNENENENENVGNDLNLEINEFNKQSKHWQKILRIKPQNKLFQNNEEETESEEEDNMMGGGLFDDDEDDDDDAAFTYGALFF